MDQERVDRFYDLVRSGEWNALAGRSAEEIFELFGAPSEVWVLDHGGHRWTRIAYRFDATPSQATDEERNAMAKGMRFSPTLLFRDGMAVPPARFDEEILGGAPTAGPPKGVEWRRGDAFP